jgi:hypothetical protein
VRRKVGVALRHGGITRAIGRVVTGAARGIGRIRRLPTIRGGYEPGTRSRLSEACHHRDDATDAFGTRLKTDTTTPTRDRPTSCDAERTESWKAPTG